LTAETLLEIARLLRSDSSVSRRYRGLPIVSISSIIRVFSSLLPQR
jgi:hypothetical protein